MPEKTYHDLKQFLTDKIEDLESHITTESGYGLALYRIASIAYKSVQIELDRLEEGDG